jgi:hypothetical protein
MRARPAKMITKIPLHSTSSRIFDLFGRQLRPIAGVRLGRQVYYNICGLFDSLSDVLRFN